MCQILELLSQKNLSLLLVQCILVPVFVLFLWLSSLTAISGQKKCIQKRKLQHNLCKLNTDCFSLPPPPLHPPPPINMAS